MSPSPDAARSQPVGGVEIVRRPFVRVGLSGLDQVVSSVTNFAVLFAAGRLLGPSGLGLVVICITGSYATIALTRAVASEPLLVFGPTFRDGALGSALLIGAVAGTACVLIGLLLGPPWRSVLLVLAPLLPLLAIQDTARYAFFADQRPGGALASDFTWALAEGAALLVAAEAHTHSAALLLGTWGVGVAAGAVYALLRLRPTFRLRSATAWMRESRRLSSWLLGQVVVGQAAGQVSLIAIGAVAGLGTVGALRAGQTLFAPLFLAIAVLPIVLLPSMRVERGMDAVDRGVRLSAAVTGIGATLYAAAVAAGGGAALAAVYGSAFRSYEAVVLPIALAAIAQALAAAPGLGSRSLKAGKAVFVTQIVATLVGFPVLIILAAANGTTGAAWGLFVQASVLCIASWATYRIVRGRQ